MKKTLILCDTYYQVIFALQLANSLKKNEKVSIAITDQSNNSFRIYKNILKSSVFNYTYFVKTKKKIAMVSNICLRAKEFFISLFGIKTKQYDFFEIYDEFICCGPSLAAHAIYAVLVKTNPRVKVSFFEEGVLSYQKEIIITGRTKLLYKLRSLLNWQNMISCAESFYCFYPEVYYGSLTCIKVPLIDSDSIVPCLLRGIFELDDSNSYKQKYIFFTSVYDFEGGEPIGEYETALRVKEIVGTDNLLIKKHPRDTRTIFEDNGFIVDSNSSVPWEVIQLSNDFSNKVFLTATSGSVLGGNLFCKKPVKTFYLYKECDLSDNSAALKTQKRIEEVLVNNEMKNVLWYAKICTNLVEIVSNE